MFEIFENQVSQILRKYIWDKIVFCINNFMERIFGGRKFAEFMAERFISLTI